VARPSPSRFARFRAPPRGRNPKKIARGAKIFSGRAARAARAPESRGARAGRAAPARGARARTRKKPGSYALGYSHE